jgi:hypothetical protein
MRGDISPLPKYVFMAWSLVKHRKNFNFTYGTIILPDGCETWFSFQEKRVLENRVPRRMFGPKTEK